MQLPEGFFIRSPETPEDYEKYYQLRHEALRKPWGQQKGTEMDEMDKKSIHAFILHGEKAIAVCRLHFNSDEQAQIRYMAVDENYRGYGFGAMIIAYMEKIAVEKNAVYMMLQARETAVPFYLKQGYEMNEKSYLLFGKIQHFKMEKKLV
jgi:predicted GNAT family N-acyltransferase